MSSSICLEVSFRCWSMSSHWSRTSQVIGEMQSLVIDSTTSLPRTTQTSNMFKFLFKFGSASLVPGLYILPSDRYHVSGMKIVYFWNLKNKLMTVASIAGGCLVELRSFSLNNAPPSEQYAHIKVNGKFAFYAKDEDGLKFRGLNTMVLDVSTCETREWRWFDTYYCSDVTCTGDHFADDQRVTGGTAAFIDYYTNHVTEGTVLLGVTADEPTAKLGPALPMLKAAGVDVGDLTIRAMFAFVMKSKGDPSKTVFIKQQSQPSAITMSVLIRAHID